MTSGTYASITWCFLLTFHTITQATFAQQREWSGNDGKFTVQASFVEQIDDIVKLKRYDNGKIISVPICV